MRPVKFSLYQAVIHIAVWMLLLFSPYLFLTGREQEDLLVMLRHSWYPVAQVAFIFYLNYFLLIDQFFLPKKYILYALINIGIVAAFRFDWLLIDMAGHKEAVPFAHQFSSRQQDNRGINHQRGPLQLFQELFTLFLPALLALLIRQNQQRANREAEKRKIENRRLKAELEHLKYQLQPHFFFNSLNNIYSLIDLAPARAQDTVHTLGKLMRYLLYEASNEEVRLSQEIGFMEKYIRLMELRQQANVTTGYRFPQKLEQDPMIAPLLFIPLIENAFKHGIAATVPAVLSFEMTVQHRTVIFRSQNPNHPKDDQDKSGSGIGLDNLRKRLALLYPGRHVLTRETRDGYYYSLLKIDLA